MNARSTNKAGPTLRRLITACIDVCGILAVLGISVFVSLAIQQQPNIPASSGLPASATMMPCQVDYDGYLMGRLYGSLNQEIDWHGDAFSCAGSPRPGGQGIRLFFANKINAGDERLVFVIGIDGEIESLENKEHVANITVIDEETARFFSTGGQQRCWTTIEQIVPAQNNPFLYRLEGAFYCSGALPLLNGGGSVTLTEFHYGAYLNTDDTQ
jgi:hypothetical protein